MKIWHDDVRPPPDESWTWVRNNEAAKTWLDRNDITEVSLDHDMGYTGPPPGPCVECHGSGIDLKLASEQKKHNSSRISRAKFDDPPCTACDGDGFIGGDVLYIAGTSDDDGYELVRWMIINSKVPPKVTIHSWNPVGAKNMRDALHDAGHSCVVRPYEI